MSKYTNNGGSQLFCIYIFTMFKSSFLGKEKKSQNGTLFQTLSLFSFKLFCLGKRMPQPSSMFLVDLTTCNAFYSVSFTIQFPSQHFWTKGNLVRRDFRTAQIVQIRALWTVGSNFCTLPRIANLMEYTEYKRNWSVLLRSTTSDLFIMH